MSCFFQRLQASQLTCVEAILFSNLGLWRFVTVEVACFNMTRGDNQNDRKKSTSKLD